jgi:REP element-mobilizing transposase RayT
MGKFQNKYRIGSHRKPNWDYSEAGHYFITICCQNQKHYLGKIENHKMILSDYGKIVEREWHESFALREELFLDEFILMPNHLHAIIIINPVQTHGRASQSNEIPQNEVKKHGRASQSNENLPQSAQAHGRASQSNENPQYSLETHGRASLRFIRKPKSISSFIAGFKSATTNKIDDFIDKKELPIKKFNRNNKFWHSNYHDHIIRNEEAYQKIKNYIIKNPEKWNEDKYR